MIKLLPTLRVDSLRNRILGVAVLATLIPSGFTLGIAYVQNRRANEEKVADELLSESGQASRALGVWLRERLYDLRIFASSYEVTENLGRAARGEAGSPTRGRLSEYLGSLNVRFPDFVQLLVIDAKGKMVATSASEVRPVHLGDEWTAGLRSHERMAVGEPFWDEKSASGKVIVGVPVTLPNGTLLGAFAAELSLAQLRDVLHGFARDSSDVMYLATAGGTLVTSSRESSARLLHTTLPRAMLNRLVEREGTAFTYDSFTGREVAGTLRPVPQVKWFVLSETPTETAFGQLRRFRNLAMLVVVALLVAVTAIAYRLGLIIVRPLDRLTRGASEVAAGNLSVDLPAGGAGEVGYLTQVFNNMVSNLRASRQELDSVNETLRQRNEELERLSTTDSLTGLSNRRFLVQRLEEEAIRSGRHTHAFAVLMADVDHFKKYNDAFGHPAGDEVLKKVAEILRQSARAVDCVARYGGEEFCIMMPVTPAAAALLLAERIRVRVETEKFPGQKVTLSIGVASLPEDASTPDAVISAADGALYEAKRAGRNRVGRYKATAKKS